MIFAAATKDFSLAVSSTQPLVRVAVMKNKDFFTLSIEGKYKVLTPSRDKVLYEGYLLLPSKVEVISSAIRMGRHQFPFRHINIIPDGEATIHVNGRPLRGELDIIDDPQEKLLAVNILGVEDYIRGVLYHEVSSRWPIESIKAQAIAARTYALYRIKNSSKRPYDLTNDIYSQVYGGRGSERYRTNIAVRMTLGLVMTYQGKLLPAYYHATCGGRTENVHEIWNEDAFPLSGIKCEFCRNSPHYRWKRNFRSKEVQDKLNAKGFSIGLIKEIKVTERNASNRVKNLEILARDGKRLTISGKDFREIVGPNNIRSNNYTVEMRGYYFDLIGSGWGHGVGMCQWGANFMARKGYLYRDILKYYYPGIDIVSYETLGF